MGRPDRVNLRNYCDQRVRGIFPTFRRARGPRFSPYKFSPSRERVADFRRVARIIKFAHMWHSTCRTVTAGLGWTRAKYKRARESLSFHVACPRCSRRVTSLSPTVHPPSVQPVPTRAPRHICAHSHLVLLVAP